jgi:hypothetical protein
VDEPALQNGCDLLMWARFVEGGAVAADAFDARMTRRAALVALGVLGQAGGAWAKAPLARLVSAAADVRAEPFGARGDGVADDRAAIQKAIDTVAARGGGTVFLPAGTYLIGAEAGASAPGGLMLRSHVALQGEAPGRSVLKLKPGANRSVIYGPQDVETLWGSGSAGGLENWTLSDIVIDGNRAMNGEGNGVWIYGFRPVVENLFIRDVAGHALRSEWGDGDPGAFGMEGMFTNVRIDTCGRHGVWFSGPHDSVLTSVFVINASQAAHNGYDAFHLTGGVSSRFVTCHGWNGSEGPRMRHILNDMAGNNDFVGCMFEGGQSTNVHAQGTASLFDGCRIFAAASGTNVLLRASEILMKATVIGSPLEGAPPSRGVVFGETGDWVAACDIDIFARDQGAGAVDFARSSGGNAVRVRGFNPAGVAYAGQPHASDSVDLNISGEGGGYLRTER